MLSDNELFYFSNFGTTKFNEKAIVFNKWHWATSMIIEEKKKNPDLYNIPHTKVSSKCT